MNVYQLFLKKVDAYVKLPCPLCQKKLKLDFSREYEENKIASLICFCQYRYRLNFFVYLEKYLQIREVFQASHNKCYTIINMNSIDLQTEQIIPYKLKIIDGANNKIIERPLMGIFLTQPEKTQDLVNIINLLS